MSRPLLLVVEDGTEYTSTLRRFLAEHFDLLRAGDAAEALEALGTRAVAVVFLDMRFDRVPVERLLGDLDELTTRFNGDPERARRFMEDNQGAYVLTALRAAGHRTPVVFSYDFDAEPRRFKNLERLHAPLGYLRDNASPEQIRETLLRFTSGTP
ncbi:MAG: hypothetical protein H6739_03220 [Alphaproteobacteria bacterium]|nr:hypothetical protein [Alphaproteobacteria bacterium]